MNPRLTFGNYPRIYSDSSESLSDSESRKRSHSPETAATKRVAERVFSSNQEEAQFNEDLSGSAVVLAPSGATAVRSSSSLLTAANASTLYDVMNYKRSGYNINEQDQFGYTALHHAVINQDRALISRLLAAGADISIQNNFDKTPIEYADSVEVLGALFCHSVENQTLVISYAQKKKNRENSLFFEMLVSYASTDVVEKILQTIKKPWRYQLILHALRGNNKAMFSSLIAATNLNRNFFTVAIETNKVWALETLSRHAKAKDYIQSYDAHGNTFLHLAVMSEHLEVIRFFLSREENNILEQNSYRSQSPNNFALSLEKAKKDRYAECVNLSILESTA